MKKRTKHVERIEALNRILDKIYARMDDLRMGLDGLIAASGISRTTVYAYNERKRQYPRYETLRLLAKAVGFDLSLVLLATAKVGRPRLKLHHA